VLLALCVSVVGGCGRAEAEPAPQVASGAKTPDAAGEPAENVVRFEYASYKDVERLFEELGYTHERWQAGVREVPKVYFATVPERWRDSTSQQVTVATKKRLFFRALAPIVLYVNELILADRSRAEKLVASYRTGQSLAEQEADWLADLATRYGVIDSTDQGLEAVKLDELLRRVDIVPLSLALSQAAEESGWGTSRFAAEGNALFGQWTWSEKAIKPKDQREGKGNYGIAAFDSTLDSVRAYMQNLNTHRAYEELRAKRAELRQGSEPISGRVLAGTLTSYSERGEAYVETLYTIMNANHLDPADQAYLEDGPVHLMIPTGKTAE
jgi:uncharacterized FlgJ-related protein